MIERIRHDLRVLRTLADAGVTPTDAALSGLWRWFGDVELILPLPVMPMTDAQRNNLSRDILAEMDDAFIRLGELEAQFGHAPTTGALADTVNRMWREYAGVWAQLVNDEIAEIPAEIQDEVVAGLVAQLRDAFGEEGLEARLRDDTVLRMSIRRSGLDPDAILAGL